MKKLPVIVGFGGINSAGRSSGHHAYLRMLYSSLQQADQQKVFQSLSHLMGLDASNAEHQKQMLKGTLIRGIEKQTFDSRHVYTHQKVDASVNPQSSALSFCMDKSKLPEPVPSHWQVEPILTDDKKVRVKLNQETTFFLPSSRDAASQVAGQLPTGLSLDELYNSRNHPRGLQMSVFAMSDALGNLGLDWDALQTLVPADQMSVYAGSAVTQLDYAGTGGLMQARLLGKRPTSKHLALSLADMPAAFVNAYIVGNAGSTGNMMGACATFLYNLKQAVQDIQEGRARIAIVGGSEAAVSPELMEGFSTMGALVSDQGVRDLNNGVLDYTTASRPFGENKGFVIGEAAQFIVLMDDELAMQVGATVHAAVPGVYTNADAYKKSIPGPGIGNYITVSKAVAGAKAILGDAAVQRSYMIAHATGTPQNRVTESEIFSRVAVAQGIDNWPVIAPKAYLGHSIAAAAGDQLMVALGAWQHGLLPGIFSIDKVADDVAQTNLDFVLKAREIDAQATPVTFLNSKGFGGNNATAAFISPYQTQAMLKKRYGEKAFSAYLNKNETVKVATDAYEQKTLNGVVPLRYRFGEGVIGPEEVEMSADKIQFKERDMWVDLQMANEFADMV